MVCLPVGFRCFVWKTPALFLGLAFFILNSYFLASGVFGISLFLGDAKYYLDIVSTGTYA